MSYESARVTEGARQWEAMATEQHNRDARDESAAHEEARIWLHIQQGKQISRDWSMADSIVEPLAELIAQDDAFLARLINHAAGMRKGGDLRNLYAEAIAKDVEALVAKAIEARAFAAALEAF